MLYPKTRYHILGLFVNSGFHLTLKSEFMLQSINHLTTTTLMLFPNETVELARLMHEDTVEQTLEGVEGAYFLESNITI